jgi:hypothetical protein
MQKFSIEQIALLASERRLSVTAQETRLTTYVTLTDGRQLVMEREDRGHPDMGPLIVSATLVDGKRRQEFTPEQVAALAKQFVHDPYGTYTSEYDKHAWLGGCWFERELREKVTRFEAVCEPAQKAILTRLAEYGEFPEVRDTQLTPEQFDSAVATAFADVAVSYVELPADSVAQTVVGSPAWKMDASPETGESWEAYHDWYVCTGNVPDHPRENRWPVVTWDDVESVFEDGWHRLHSYYKQGHDTIPIVAWDRSAAIRAVSELRWTLDTM